MTEWEIADTPNQYCDMCDEKLPLQSVCRIDESICLCPSCFERIEHIPESDLKAGIKRLLDRNIL